MRRTESRDTNAMASHSYGTNPDHAKAAGNRAVLGRNQVCVIMQSSLLHKICRLLFAARIRLCLYMKKKGGDQMKIKVHVRAGGGAKAR
jgi:hypothetical protein